MHYDIPVSKECLQLVIPSSGSPAKPLCSTAFQFPNRVCNSFFEIRAPLQNHYVLQYSSVQGGSAVSFSKFGFPFRTMFYNIPAFKNGLRFVFPNSGSSAKPLCLTAELKKHCLTLYMKVQKVNSRIVLRVFLFSCILLFISSFITLGISQREQYRKSQEKKLPCKTHFKQ